jgi:hypothetical protein
VLEYSITEGIGDHSDCMALVERILSKIILWTSASLTYVSHLQLIKSVLFFIQVYWFIMFILLCSIIRNIEGLLATFLWKGSFISSLGAKMAWALVCYPIQEGGLRIKRVKSWNKIAIIKHV